MFLTRKDLVGATAAALVALAYFANAQAWWYLESNRWAAVTIVTIGIVGFLMAARVVGEKLSAPIVMLGLVGVAALVFSILAIATAAHWALVTLAIVVVGLWAATTLRHAVTPPRLAGTAGRPRSGGLRLGTR